MLQVLHTAGSLPAAAGRGPGEYLPSLWRNAGIDSSRLLPALLQDGEASVTPVTLTGKLTFHRGKVPESKTGYYSDVKVVSAREDIPWNEVS